MNIEGAATDRIAVQGGATEHGRMAVTPINTAAVDMSDKTVAATDNRRSFRISLRVRLLSNEEAVAFGKALVAYLGAR